MATDRIMVGAHPWVYAASQPECDIFPILDRIFADMQWAGLDGIELMHTAFRPDCAVARIGELSDKHSLPIIGTSFGANMWNRDDREEILADAELVVSRLAKVGGRTLGVSVGATPHPKTPAQLDAQAELLRRILDLCRAHDVVLNLHNHTYEVKDDLHDLRGTLERLPEVRLGPDLNWLRRAEVDPVEFIRTFGDRIVFLHLRDQHADGKWSEALGEGDMAYGRIGEALSDIGFTGDAVIELAHERDFVPTRPLRESLRISRERAREVLVASGVER